MESVIFFYALVVLVAVSVPTFWLGRRFVLRKKLVCPDKKRRVRVEFVCRGSYRNVIPLRVRSCSAFQRPRKVECAQNCLSMVGASDGSHRKGLLARH